MAELIEAGVRVRFACDYLGPREISDDAGAATLAASAAALVTAAQCCGARKQPRPDPLRPKAHRNAPPASKTCTRWLPLSHTNTKPA